LIDLFMKKILIPFLLIAVTVASCNSSSNENGGADNDDQVNPDNVEFETNDEGSQVTSYPVISFDSKSVDVGTMTEGEIKQFKFKFTNTGTADLIIKNAQGSCGCTVPSYPEHPIKPGESAEIDVEFDSAGKQGENQKNVTVWTNCKEPQEQLTFYASVLPKQ
jgi:hypothetical protein